MFLTPPANGPVPTLSPGDVVLLTAALLTAPGNSMAFAIRRGTVGGGAAPLLSLWAQGTATVVTATLQVSFDGGTTWGTYGTSTALALFQNSQQIQVVPGPLYRVNVTTLTGTNANIYAAVS
jgi:hypothetical protein